MVSNEELRRCLELHKKWINKEPDGEQMDLRGANLQDTNLQDADLRGANLQDADLQDANLRGADLRKADLRGANLRGADLDFSCWPLQGGSFEVKVCKNIAAQLAYHFCRIDCEDEEVKACQRALYPLANKFYRVEECGKLE